MIGSKLLVAQEICREFTCPLYLSLISTIDGSEIDTIKLTEYLFMKIHIFRSIGDVDGDGLAEVLMHYDSRERIVEVAEREMRLYEIYDPRHVLLSLGPAYPLMHPYMFLLDAYERNGKGYLIVADRAEMRIKLVEFLYIAAPDSTPPRLFVTSPREGDVITLPYVVMGRAYDEESDIVRVDISLVQASTGKSVELRARYDPDTGYFEATIPESVRSGRYQIVLECVSDAGLRASVAINVIIDAGPTPAVTPTTGDRSPFPANAVFTIAIIIVTLVIIIVILLWLWTRR